MKASQIGIGLLILLILAAAGYWVYQNYLAPEPAQPALVSAAGTEAQSASVVSAEGKVVPARVANLGFTQGGRVAQVLVQENDQVQQGDPLVRLESSAQEAAVAQAQASLQAAQAGLQAAQTRQAQVQQSVRLQEAGIRIADWSERSPSQISQPAWYFDQPQQIASAQAEAEAARSALEDESASLAATLVDVNNADFLTAENRLADTQASFRVASDLLDEARSSGSRDLQDQAQAQYDIALSRLEAAQTDYEQVVSEEEAANVLEARARYQVAQERNHLAQERLDRLNTGDYSLDLQAAEKAVTQAEAGVAQAEAALQAAQAALDQTALLAPFAGTVAQIGAVEGEIAAPGMIIVRLADLGSWQVETTDLAENDVTLLETGLPATVTLDAFPGRSFEGSIREIALFGEDSRGSVVYTVWVDFDPHDATVRWGMTAFVDINLP